MAFGAILAALTQPTGHLIVVCIQAIAPIAVSFRRCFSLFPPRSRGSGAAVVHGGLLQLALKWPEPPHCSDGCFGHAAPQGLLSRGGALRHYHLVLEARDIVRPSPPRAGLFDRTVLFRLRTRTPSKHALDEAERGQYRMRAGSVDKLNVRVNRSGCTVSAVDPIAECARQVGERIGGASPSRGKI